MSNLGSNNKEPDNTETEDNNTDESLMKSSTNTSLLMPVALLLVLLIIPFSINSFMHMVANKGQYVHPVIMKLPIDSISVTAPTEAKQYESFEVVLNINTQQLAKFINDMVSIASEGTSIQGITGFISPNMEAEITSEAFRIENSGPQDQLFSANDTTEWKWQVMPESSGIQKINFKMHVTSTEYGHQKIDILELAEANIAVDSNPTMWIVYNWWVIALLGLAIFGGWKALRRYNV